MVSDSARGLMGGDSTELATLRQSLSRCDLSEMAFTMEFEFECQPAHAESTAPWHIAADRVVSERRPSAPKTFSNSPNSPKNVVLAAQGSFSEMLQVTPAPADAAECTWSPGPSRSPF